MKEPIECKTCGLLKSTVDDLAPFGPACVKGGKHEFPKEHKITCHHRTSHIHDNADFKCRCMCTCFIPAKCNCEEISCQEGCVKKHTHKVFSCGHCKPPESAQRTGDENHIVQMDEMVSPTEDWEEKFDWYHSRFNSQNVQYCNLGPEGVYNLKSFIRNELSKSRQETIEEVVKIVEGMKINMYKIPSAEVLIAEGKEIESYNRALSDILTKLKEVKNKQQ